MAYRHDPASWSFNTIAPDAGFRSPDIAQNRYSASSDSSYYDLPVDQVEFQTLTERTFPHSVQPNLVAASTRRKLIAAVTGEKQLECYRYDGSRAFWYRRGGHASLVALAWHKQNDDVLQVVWSDGKLEHVSSKTGRAIKTVWLRPSDGRDHVLIGFAPTYFESSFARYLKKVPALEDIDEAERYVANASGPKQVTPDVAAEMKWLDVQAELPKLSSLLVAPIDATIPSLKGDHESLIKQEVLDHESSAYPGDRSRGSLNIAFAVWADGYVSFVYEASSILIGSKTLLVTKSAEPSTANGNEENTRQDVPHNILQNFCSGWTSSTLRLPFLVDKPLATGEGISRTIGMVSMDDLHHTRSYLNELDFLLNRAEFLTEYIKQVVVNVRALFHGWRRVPGGWIELGNEALQEGNSKLSLSDALYRFAVTGDMPQPVREWAKSTVGNTNVKRWISEVDAGYTSMLDAVHNCLLPALDRLGIITNRLLVLNNTPEIVLLHEADSIIAQITTSTNTLRLLGHAVLQYAAGETKQFGSFSDWLSLTVDYAMLEVGGDRSDEIFEKLTNTDYLSILPYITGALTSSRLEALLGSATQDIKVKIADKKGVYDMSLVRAALSTYRGAAVNPASSGAESLDLLFHALRLDEGIRQVLSSVTSEFENLFNLEVSNLPVQIPQLSNVRRVNVVQELMNYDKIGASQSTRIATYIASQLEGGRSNEMIVLRSSHASVPVADHENVSGDSRISRISFSAGAVTIKDICWFDDQCYLVLLWYPQAARSYILRLPKHTRPVAERHVSRPSSVGAQSELALSRRSDLEVSYLVNFPEKPVTACSDDWAEDQTLSLDTIQQMSVYIFEHPNADDFVPATISYDTGKLVILDQSTKKVRLMTYKKPPYSPLDEEMVDC